MRLLRLTLLAASLACAANPLLAQKKSDAETGSGITVTVALTKPPFEVYRSAFHALQRGGYSLRAGLIDRGVLMTLPLAPKDTSLGRDLVVVAVQVDSAADSTRVRISAQTVDAEGRPIAGPASMAQAIVAAVAVSSGMEGKDAPVLPALAVRHGYAYDPTNPVHMWTGGEGGHDAQVRYLASLKGPAGQPTRFARLGSCCAFERSGNPPQGRLDVWEVTYDGAPAPVLLYLDFYALENPHAPEGFTGGIPAPQPVKPAAAR